MSRAWIPYLVIAPFAVGTLASACSAGGGPDSDKNLDGNSGGKSSTSGGSGGRGSLTGGATATGSGGTIMVGGPVDPCEAAGVSAEDCMVQRQPGCGDGMINQPNEECDDGNSFPGDCCSGSCTVEPYCDCSSGTCVSTIICGDGMRGPGEACDDGNVESGDGCSADCHVVEIGHRCPVPGMPCERYYVCGDGIHDPNEGCDDGNLMPGDGCSATCRIELGAKCEGSPSVCSPTTCGDNVVEGAESCDDGNTIPFDGCSPDCRAEPACETGEACTSSCGDGIVFGGEDCDDGNLRDGDGCSSSCTVEEGYLCNNDPPCERRTGVDPVTQEMGEICAIEVPAIFRDFNGHSASGGHPDFAPGYNSPGARQGLVKPMLDAEGKPELTAPNEQAFLHSVAGFRSWYRDGAPASPPITSRIVLWDKAGIEGDGSAGYVNRWGKNGEQWQGPITATAYEPIVYGGPAGGGCEACTPSATGMCYDPCTPWAGNEDSACCAEIPRTPGYDGNPLFFPIDSAPGILMETRQAAEVPQQYWGNWTAEATVATTLGITMPIETSTAPFPSPTHNFSFTSEVKYWFKYDASATATLDFTGDDDVWVFLNGRLAVDLGSWHVPLNGSLTIANNIRTSANLDVTMPPTVVTDTSSAAEFGLEDGNVYQIAVFHAEREKTGSSFKLTLAGFNMTPSDCRTNCGDAMVGPGEECDDGTNRGGYNECAPGCLLGPRCGDGVVQTDYGEACDDGVNAGAYGGCGPDCQPGPRCGDGVVTPGMEECDDGANEGNYGGCDVGCRIGPHCGDGFISSDIDPNTGYPYEECDDMNDVAEDGCSNCKVDIVVPK